MTVLSNLNDVNYLAVLVATVAFMIIGALWYSPLLFAKPWMADTGITAERASQTNNAPLYVITAVLALISSLTLALFLEGDPGAGNGAVTGLVAGIGFALTSMATTGLFNYTKPRLTLIQAGYYVVSLTVAGAIIGAFG